MVKHYPILLLIMLAGLQRMQAQDMSNYAFSTHTNGTFADMSGSIQLIGPQVHSGTSGAFTSFQVSDFDFFLPGSNAPVGFIGVSVSGLISLDAATSTNLTLPALNRHLIAPFYTISGNSGERMGTSNTGQVHYKINGAAPNRTVVIEYQDMSLPHWTNPGSISFQVQLEETTGIIRFMYGNMALGHQSSGPVQIGFSSSRSSSHLFLSVNSMSNSVQSTVFENLNFSSPPQAIANLHSPAEGSRRTYIFTPPLPLAPLGMQVVAIGSGSQSISVSAAPGTTAYRYLIYQSMQPAGPFTFAGMATGNTYLATGLQPNTTYYYRAYALNEGAVNRAFVTTSAATTAPGIVYSARSGNWSDAATWQGALLPSRFDDVVINALDTININMEAQCKSAVVLGDVRFTVNTQLQIFGSNVFIGGGGSLRANGAGSRGLILNDCDLINNGVLEFSQEGNAISFQLNGNTREFSGGLTTNGPAGNPAHTAVLRRLTINRMNETASPAVLRINFPLIISENLNLVHGYISNFNDLIFDNTATVPGTTAGSHVSITHFSHPETGILGNVHFGAAATYNLIYSNQNQTGIVQGGKEIPVNKTISTLSLNNTVGVVADKDIQAININGFAPLVMGSHHLTIGASAAEPGGLAQAPVFGTGTITRWYGTAAVNAGAANAIFPFYNGTPETRETRIVNIAPLQGTTAGGTITVRHVNQPGQTNFSAPFFENNNGYIRRSNTYWEVSTGNGLDATGMEIQIHTQGMPNAAVFPNYTASNVTLENGAAPGLHIAAQPRNAIPPYAIIKRSLNSMQLNNRFHLGENDPLLPLHLLSFGARAEAGNAILQWQTQAEINVSHFEIERSDNGTHWTMIGKVKASGGSFVQQYMYTDVKIPAGMQWYRLKMKDKDGSHQYSKIVAVQQAAVSAFELENVFPNPTSGMVQLKYKLPHTATVQVTLIDALGMTSHLTTWKEQIPGNYQQTLQLKNTHRAPGLYYLQLTFISAQGSLLQQLLQPVYIR